jgi:hypothetical protein
MVEDEGYLSYLRQVFDLPAPPTPGSGPVIRTAPVML